MAVEVLQRQGTPSADSLGVILPAPAETIWAPITLPFAPFLIPRHPAPMKDSGLLTPSVARPIGNPENERGFDNELRVGRLLARVDFVDQVRQVDPHSQEDIDLKDLVVTMVSGYPIGQVFVQVKSSFWGVENFFNEVGKRLDREDQRTRRSRDKTNGDLEYQARRDWMARQRFMCINAGERRGVSVTDFYILDKFMREMELIIARSRALV